MIFLKKRFAVPLALLLNQASADAVVDWHWYPSASQGCLQSAQNTVQCPSGDVPSFNGCVCRNGNGFLQNAAQCLGASDSGDLNTVFNVLVSNCGQSQTPVEISLSTWMSWASASTPQPPNTTPPLTTVVTQPAVTVVNKPTTVVNQPTTVVNQQTAVVNQPTTVVNQQTTVVNQQTTVVDQPTTVVNQPATVVVNGQTTTLASSARTTSSGTTGIIDGGPSLSTGSPVPVANSKKLGTGAVIGLGVGVPGCVAAIGLLGLLLFRTCRKKPQDDPGRLEGETMQNGGYGPSGGVAGEAYNKRPESFPSTVSPVLSTGTSQFSAGQGPYPPPQPPYVGQTVYAAQYPELPAGQPYQPQYPTMGHQYDPTAAPGIPHSAPGQYSELVADSGAHMPGAQMFVPQGGMTPRHELPGPG
jgi:hypothetical protein